jgi:nucleotide-binding universal stress UspA family protein
MFKHPVYLVPHDFSSISDSATRLAIDLAEANNGSAYLLHIVTKESEKIEARKTFDRLVADMSEKDRSYVTTNVLEGNLFEDVGKAGDILKASLIVMGTHGAKGMQKFFGSHAVRMISNSVSPFLITQGKKKVEKINTIVMPFNFAKESIQIASFAGSIAKKFNAKIHLVGLHDSDQWLANKTQSNLIVLRRHFADAGVENEIVNLDGKGSYEKELLTYSESVDADIIAAAYFKEGVLPTPNSFIQHMIENEKQIPLLTVNAAELSVINSNFTFMSV